MSLVFAGICSHAPGIVGRAAMADAALREPLYAAYGRLRAQLRAARPDALVVVAAEHFANFFMNNMPSFAIGMADQYRGPIEDPAWLGIARRQIPGTAAHAAAPCLGPRRGAAARRRPAAGAARHHRYRRHLALAGDARLRQDQRGLGP